MLKKKFLPGFAVAALLATLFNTVQIEVGAAAGAIAAYSFDDGAGLSAADASGHGNAGILVNGPTWVAGHSGSALTFDGVNDYVMAGNIPALNGLSAVTVSAWVKGSVGASSPDAVIVAKDQAFALVVDGHKARFGVKAGSNWYGFPGSSTSVDDGNFHFLAGVYDGTTIRVYVDGIQEASQNIGTRTLNSPVTNLEFAGCTGGPDCHASGELWHGIIDDIRVYDRALSQSEVQIDRDMPVAPPDVTAPAAPANVTGTAVSLSEIDLSWTASTDNVAVTGYRVFRNGAPIGTSTAPSFADGALSPATPYTYTVVAFDAAGNTSALSTPTTLTTLSDTTPPSVPTNLAGTPISPNQISLGWTASTDNVGVIGYTVFRNGVSIATTATTSFADGTLTPSTLYTYTVAAFDAGGNTSAVSGPLSLTTPAVADTQAPSVPTNVAGAASSSSQISLTWTASTDNVGVTGYKVFRDGAQIATLIATSYIDSGLTPSTSHAYGVAAFDAAGNTSASSASINVSTSGDTTAPSVPTNLSATSVSSAQVTLTWTPSTDNVAVAGYTVFRNGSQIGTSVTPSYNDAGLTASTPYTYAVAAYDAALNVSVPSDAIVVTTSNTSLSTVLARDDFNRPDAPDPGPNWTVIDSWPLVVNQHLQELRTSDGWDAIAIYTPVTWPSDQYAQLRILAANEHSGCAPVVRTKNDTVIEMYMAYVTGPLGPGARLTVAKFITHLYTELWTSTQTVNVGDTLYLGMVGSTLTVKLNGTTIKTLTDTSLTAGYAGIDVTNYDAGPVGGSQCDDWEGGSLNGLSTPTNVIGTASSSTQINLGWAASTGPTQVAGYTVLRNGVSVATSTTTSYADAGLTLGTSYTYAISAFDAAGNFSDASAPITVMTGGDTTAPSVPSNVAGTAVSSSQINLGWSASTDNVGVTGYKVFRNGAQIATSATPAYADAGLALGTTYSYAVAAFDASGNVSAASAPINVATLGDTAAPSVPTNVAGAAVSSSQINLTWTASVDNVAVTGYKVFRNGAQIATSTTPSYIDSGLTLGTTYAYGLAAFDAAGNTSVASAPINVTTLGDTVAPSVPTNVAGTAVSSGQINLTWTASSDNVAVTSYKIRRNGTVVGTAPGLLYSDAGLTAGTTYTYTVSAVDATGNESLPSTPVSVTTNSGGLAGPVVAFGFNEGSGLVANDSSGHGYSGTLVNGPVWAPGHSGTAINFDGVNDYVNAGNVPSLNGLQAVTVSAWVKGSVGASSGDAVIVAKDTAFALIVKSHKALFGVKSGNTWYGFPSSTTNVDDGNFHFLTGVYDGTTIRVYVDGILRASQTIGTRTLNVASTNVEIASCAGGPNCDTSGEMWKGLIDDVRIYNRALSAAEIMTDMQNSIP